MDELVKGFAEGQLSRRVFIRRMVVGGASLGAATMFANLIQASPAEASSANVNVLDYSLTPSTLHLNHPDDYVFFDWDPSASGHSITETSGLNLFDSSPYPNPPSPWAWVSDFGFGFWAAGTYHYTCKDTLHSPMNGTIQAPIKITRVGAKKASLQWGSRDLAADPTFPNLRYDVQVKKPGHNWQAWQNGSGAFTATYHSRLAGTHRFRARLRDVTTQTSLNYSPVAVFKI